MGALLALMLCGMEFDIVALIGIVLLIGIVKKNAIMMIDFALEAEREEKLSPIESIKKACLLRFRPIMMTSFAALLGGLPLALEGGTGQRAAQAAGGQHRGRAADQPGAHPVHHAGHLPVHGALRPVDRGAPASGKATRRPRGLRGEPARRGASDGRFRTGGAGGTVLTRGAASISEPFIRRPIGTSLLAAAIILLGASAYTQLPVAPLPRVDLPTISVNASLPGASPETMSSAVATPLERRLGRIAGLTDMTSTSSLGSTSITLQFDLDRDQDSAGRDVQAAINAASADLPTNLPFRPNYRKVNPTDTPIMIIALTSATLPLPQVFDAADTVLAQRIAQVEGVGQVFVGGGQQPAVRVQVDPEAAAGVNLTLADVRHRAHRRLGEPAGGRRGQRARRRRPWPPTTSSSAPTSTATSSLAQTPTGWCGWATWRRWRTASRTPGSPGGPTACARC